MVVRKCSFHILFSRHIPVEGDVWEYYKAIGAEKSQLGFPIEAGDSSFSPRGAQFFEGGRIFWQSDTGPISVLGGALEFTQDSGRYRSLGYPLTEEEPVGADGSGRIQFFERGVLTWGDGEYEEWLRPDEKAAEPDPAAHANDDGALPLANYDEMTVTSLSAWLGALPVGQLNQLIEYENSHAARPDVLAMLKQHRPPEPYLQGRWIQDRSKREG